MEARVRSAGNGKATDGTVHKISSSGNCTLTMEDSFGDGWNGAEWEVPGLGLGPFFLPDGKKTEVSFEVNPGFALGFDGDPCNGDGVATVAFQYHMFKDGALSLESAEGATLWTKTGITARHTVDVKGGTYPSEVSWKLECGGVPAGNGRATDGTVHVISFRPLLSSGNCKLTMEDSYGDGWNGAEWSVPSLNLGPFSMPVGSTYTAEVSFNVPPGDTGWIQSEAVPVNSASFRFVYVPPESSPPLSTAAIAQMAVCCSPPAASSTTFVHHSVPHSFADAGACLHTKGPPLTIREDATSTVSATRTPPRDSNHRACCLTRLRRALWQPGLPSLAGATRTWSRCLCRCACKSPIAQTAMSPRSRSAWMPPSRTSSPCRAG